MPNIISRKFVSHCPFCKRLMADSAKPHCDYKISPQCPWMRCKCGAIISENGTWTNGKERGVAS